MINAGLPLIQCLDLLGKQEQNKTFAKVIGSGQGGYRGGSTLTDALRKFPKIFDELFVNLVRGRRERRYPRRDPPAPVGLHGERR